MPIGHKVLVPQIYDFMDKWIMNYEHYLFIRIIILCPISIAFNIKPTKVTGA
jgi:hypothetical protein